MLITYIYIVSCVTQHNLNTRMHPCCISTWTRAHSSALRAKCIADTLGMCLLPSRESFVTCVLLCDTVCVDKLSCEEVIKSLGSMGVPGEEFLYKHQPSGSCRDTLPLIRSTHLHTHGKVVNFNKMKNSLAILRHLAWIHYMVVYYHHYCCCCPLVSLLMAIILFLLMFLSVSQYC